MRDELPVLVLFDGWNSLFRDRVVPWRIAMAERTRSQLERDVLPRLPRVAALVRGQGRRVAAGAHRRPDAVERRIADLDDRAARAGRRRRSRSPISCRSRWCGRTATTSASAPRAPATIARVRQQAQVGVLADAFADDAFCRALVDAMRVRGKGSRHRARQAPLHADGGVRAHRRRRSTAALPVRRPQAQSSNSVVTLGTRLFLKGYRRLRPGTNVELEIGRYLTEVARFPYCVPVAGSLEYASAEGVTARRSRCCRPTSPTRADGWTYTRRLPRALPRAAAHRARSRRRRTRTTRTSAIIRTLGLRTAELHLALAATLGRSGVRPGAADRRRTSPRGSARPEEAGRTLTLLEQSSRAACRAPARDEAQALLAQRERAARAHRRGRS